MSTAGEFRHALRSLRRNPGCTLTCVLLLAPGVGANAAIGSVFHSAAWKPLPYSEPGRLVMVWQRFPNMPDPPGGRIPTCRRNWLEWSRQNTVFSGMAAFREKTLDETSRDPARRVPVGGFASEDFFALLGVSARPGRLSGAGDDSAAVLTDSFFTSRFHRDPAAIGKSLALGGESYTIAGVLPREFHLPSTGGGSGQLRPEVRVPLNRLFQKQDDERPWQL